MHAVINACNNGSIDATVCRVISNRPDALGLAIAKQNNITTDVCDHQQYATRAEFDKAIAESIEKAQPDWVLLAGFMRILSSDTVKQYLGRMINIHPSLLPKYPGLNTHERALAAGDTEHGASVHFVTPELDAGPIIGQITVPIVKGDTSATLAQRVLAQEHKLLVESMQLCVSGAARFTHPESI